MSFITYNQIPVPSFMYGTAWKKQATARLVEQAVSAGFRALDTANQLIHYEEALVGEALLALKAKGIPREKLFVQTKFTPRSGQDHRTPYDPSADLTTQVQQSFRSSLEHLHTESIDAFLLHGPYSRVGLGTADWEVWAAFEDLYRSGKTRTIGVSNVNADQLTQFCRQADIRPMVVQNRCYAALGWDQDVREVCRAYEVVYQGFSLLTANRECLGHPVTLNIAQRLGAKPAQVIFRFAMSIGILPLTGTTNPQHMTEDLQAERLELTEDEIRSLERIFS